MFRDIFPTRLLIVGLVFFALVAVGTQLYSWGVRRTTEAELERHDQFLQGLENNNETRPVQRVHARKQRGTASLQHSILSVSKATREAIGFRDRAI